MQVYTDKFCPNMFYSGNNKTIGEFKTLEECMEYPLKEVWPINRTEHNLFEKYKSEGDRFFIIHSCDRNLLDRYRWVILVAHKDNTMDYFDAYDMPIVEFFWPGFENSLGEEAMDAIKQQISNPFMSIATACCSNNTK